MTERAKRVVIVSAAALLGCTALRAAEKAQFEGSTTVELPKPKRSFEESRRLDLKPDHPGPDGAFSTVAPSDTAPLTTKRLREELDKKKNWIFLNPYENHYDSKTEEFMKGEKGTGLYDNHLMQSQEEKGAVEKYIQEKEGRNSNASSRNDREALTDRDRASERENSVFNPRNDKESKTDDASSFSTPEKTPFEKAIFSSSSGSMDPLKSSALEKSLTRDPLPDDPFAAAQKISASTFEQNDLKEKQALHEREFDQLLQARPGATLAAPTVGPGGDVGRLDLGASTLQRRSDPYANGARIGGNIATFTDGAGDSAFNIKSDYGSRGFGESFISEPTKPAASIAPSLPGPSASPSSVMAPAPFVLPFPQRKF